MIGMFPPPTPKRTIAQCLQLNASPACSELALNDNVQHVVPRGSQSTLCHHLFLLMALGILLVIISGGQGGRKQFITFYYRNA